MKYPKAGVHSRVMSQEPGTVTALVHLWFLVDRGITGDGGMLENQIWLFPKAKSHARGGVPNIYIQCYKHTHRRQLLDKVVGNMNQVLVFMETLLKPFALFIFQQIKVNSSIQEGLD